MTPASPIATLVHRTPLGRGVRDLLKQGTFTCAPSGDGLSCEVEGEYQLAAK